MSPNPMGTFILYFDSFRASATSEHFLLFKTSSSHNMVFSQFVSLIITTIWQTFHFSDIDLVQVIPCSHSLYFLWIMLIYFPDQQFLFISQRLCEVFDFSPVLPHLSHSIFKFNILKIHIIFLVKLASPLIYSYFLVVQTRKFGNITDFSFFFYDQIQ